MRNLILSLMFTSFIYAGDPHGIWIGCDKYLPPDQKITVTDIISETKINGVPQSPAMTCTGLKGLYSPNNSIDGVSDTNDPHATYQKQLLFNGDYSSDDQRTTCSQENFAYLTDTGQRVGNAPYFTTDLMIVFNDINNISHRCWTSNQAFGIGYRSDVDSKWPVITRAIDTPIQCDTGHYLLRQDPNQGYGVYFVALDS